MQTEPHTFLSRHGYLLLALPGSLVLSLAIVLFESSANMGVYEFKQGLASLIQPDQSGSSQPAQLSDANTTRKIPPISSGPNRNQSSLYLARDAPAHIVIPLYVGLACGLIIYRAHPRRRLLIVCGIGAMLCLAGLTFLAAQNEHHVIYRAVYGFAYLITLDGARPMAADQEFEMYSESLRSA